MKFFAGRLGTFLPGFRLFTFFITDTFFRSLFRFQFLPFDWGPFGLEFFFPNLTPGGRCIGLFFGLSLGGCYRRGLMFCPPDGRSRNPSLLSDVGAGPTFQRPLFYSRTQRYLSTPFPRYHPFWIADPTRFSSFVMILKPNLLVFPLHHPPLSLQKNETRLNAIMRSPYPADFLTFIRRSPTPTLTGLFFSFPFLPPLPPSTKKAIRIVLRPRITRLQP